MKLRVITVLISFSLTVFAQDSGNNPRILSAYHGLDSLPPLARLLCGRGVTGQDGMPVTFSNQIDIESVTPEIFVVETGGGEKVTPICATLRPAAELLERRTVLLVGSFGTPAMPPKAVEIVGQLKDINGNSLQGLRIETITPIASGPSLVFAERFKPDTPGLERECPKATRQALLLTWEGGVSGPAGADLGEPQRLGISVQLENGSQVNPIALGDDDPDNHVVACLNESSPAESVNVEAGLFHDPGNDPNPETRINVL